MVRHAPAHLEGGADRLKCRRVAQAPESGRVQGTVLEPCAISAEATMRPGGSGDCAVTVSDLRLNVSADLLELAQSLQQTVLAPLVAPPVDR